MAQQRFIGFVTCICLACFGVGASADSGDTSPKYGGFGGSATGGAGKPSVEVKSFAELKAALAKGNATILIKTAVIECPEPITTGADNITLDGQGATLRGDKIAAANKAILTLGGKNLIVRNLRLRNGPENLFFKGAQKVLVDHVSSTGANADGISFMNGTKDATLTHCFMAGCTKAVQVRRQGEPGRITMDHCLLTKSFFRSPIFEAVREFDVRNNLIMDWGPYGFMSSNPECAGNIMGNLFVLNEGAPGNKQAAITWDSRQAKKVPGKVFMKDNVFRNCSTEKKSTTDAPRTAPAIVPAYTTDLEALEKKLLSDTEGAGCMPRDRVDKDYLAAKKWQVTHDNGFRIPKTGEELPK